MTIRKQPGDFVVREVLAPEAAAALSAERGGRRHAVYELRKASLTTPEAVRGLARALRVREGDVSYAGLKDKHARTVQHAAAALPPGAGAPRRAEGRGWSARMLGWSARPLDASAIERNEFAIIVRDLDAAAAAEMDRRAAVLRHAGDDRGGLLLIVNYFGDQRFGSARHGRGFAARHMALGEFEEALRLAIATPARKDTGLRRRFTRLAAQGWGDWASLAATLPSCPERRPIERLAAGAGFDAAIAALPAFLRGMLLEAYQSHLWNKTAHRLAAGLNGCGDRGGIVADDPFGEMYFPAPGVVPAGIRTMTVPLLAPGVTLGGAWGAAAADVLREEGITLRDLNLPPALGVFFGTAERPLFVEASAFELGPARPDELASRSSRLMRRVRFDLPRGAYATVVLRALGQ